MRFHAPGSVLWTGLVSSEAVQSFGGSYLVPKGFSGIVRGLTQTSNQTSATNTSATAKPYFIVRHNSNNRNDSSVGMFGGINSSPGIVATGVVTASVYQGPGQVLDVSHFIGWRVKGGDVLTLKLDNLNKFVGHFYFAVEILLGPGEV